MSGGKRKNLTELLVRSTFTPLVTEKQKEKQT